MKPVFSELFFADSILSSLSADYMHFFYKSAMIATVLCMSVLTHRHNLKSQIWIENKWWEHTPSLWVTWNYAHSETSSRLHEIKLRSIDCARLIFHLDPEIDLNGGGEEACEYISDGARDGHWRIRRSRSRPWSGSGHETSKLVRPAAAATQHPRRDVQYTTTQTHWLQTPPDHEDGRNKVVILVALVTRVELDPAPRRKRYYAADKMPQNHATNQNTAQKIQNKKHK